MSRPSGRAFGVVAVVAGISLAATLFLASGCSDDEPTAPAPAGPATVRATVDGASWASGVSVPLGVADTSIVIFEFPVNDTTRALIVTGNRVTAQDPDGSAIVLGFYGRFRVPATFALDPAPSEINLGMPPAATLKWAVWVDDLADTASFVTDATHRGTLSFTRYDGVTQTLEGTFDFRAVHPVSGDSVTVTGGSFLLELTPSTRRHSRAAVAALDSARGLRLLLRR